MLSVDQILAKHYRPEDHPYRQYERKVESILKPEHTILDAGCGRSAPVLSKYIGRAVKLIGVDLEDYTSSSGEIEYIQGNIASIEVPSASIDIVISRAVLEHVPDPSAVFSEVDRILKPGGSFIFLTPNLWDYVSIISFLVPNRFHPYIVNKTEGRIMEDVFPSYYKANTHRAISNLCKETKLSIHEFKWLSQYPAGFMFSAILFRVAMVYEKLISRFDALAFLRGWLLVHIQKQ
jgi:ubiquinone/menaquinone biosynthesis C-methylase UbiE